MVFTKYALVDSGGSSTNACGRPDGLLQLAQSGIVA